MKTLGIILCRVVALLTIALPGCDAMGPPAILTPQFTLSSAVSGKGRIQIMRDGGQADFTSEAFAQGTLVTLVAIPDDGWLFVRWEGAAGGTNAQVGVMVDADSSVTAVFIAIAGVRTITVDGLIGRMTIALRGNQVRGNEREGDIGSDLEGTLTGNQLLLASTSPGFENATISASIQPDGSLQGTINGSGFANAPFSGDPVALSAFEDNASGQRTTSIDGTNGVLTVAVAPPVVRGTWRIFSSFGADVEGTIDGNQITFTATIPGLPASTVAATIQSDGSWVGTINGSGFVNDPFTAQPSFFP